MVRRGRTLAARGLLLATALSFAGSEPSWSLGGGGGPPPALGIPAPPGVTQQAANTLITLGNSFTWMMDPTMAAGVTTTGVWMISNAQEFTALYTSNPGLISQTVRAGSSVASNPAAVLKQMLAAINAMINGRTPPWPPLLAAVWGSFSSYQQLAADNGVNVYTLLANDTLWELNLVYSYVHLGSTYNPFVYTTTVTHQQLLQFTDEPAPAPGFPDDIALAYASTLGGSRVPAAPAFVPGWAAWASGYGGYNRTNGDAAGSNTLTARLYGSVAGLEYRFTPQTLLGLSLGGAGMTWGAGSSGSGNSDSFQFGVYGITHFGAAYVSGLLSASTNWFNTNRFVAGDELAAKFNAQSYSGRLEGGYRYPMWLTSGVTPYAALQLQYFQTPSYSETDLSGGGMGDNYSAADGTDTRSELGARFDTVQSVGGMPLILRARAAWAHDWVNSSSVTAAFQVAPGSNFIVSGSPLVPSDSALASLEAELHLTSNWSLAAKFDGQFASSSQTYLGSGTLHYTW